jgi:membrane protease YdiL (CAAX protease family)
MTGALWPAVLLCAATFGIGHARQGRRFVLIAALFALVFHALTLVTGSLYVAIAVHAAINITVGLRAGRWVRPPA